MDIIAQVQHLQPVIAAIADQPVGEGLRILAEHVAGTGLELTLAGGWSRAREARAKRRNSDLENVLRDAWDSALDAHIGAVGDPAGRWRQIKTAGDVALDPGAEPYPSALLDAVLFEKPEHECWHEGWTALSRCIRENGGDPDLILQPAECDELAGPIYKKFGELLEHKNHASASIAFQREMLRETVRNLKALGKTQSELLDKLSDLAEIPDLVEAVHSILANADRDRTEQQRVAARQLEVLANVLDSLDSIERRLTGFGQSPLRIEGKAISFRLAATCERIRTSLLDSDAWPVVGFDDRFERFDRIVRDHRWVLVTGPSGSGKSSFLANWIERQQQNPGLRCAYHFFSLQQGTSAVAAGMKCLCEQLLHDYRLDVPALETEPERLKAIFSQLVTIPRAATRTVVVLDAIDEAVDSSKPGQFAFDPSWFPERLPDGVTIVLSVRDVDDEDTRAVVERELGRKKPFHPFPIELLETPDVAQLIAKADVPAGFVAWADKTDAARRIIDITGGLAIFVRYLIDDLRQQPDSTVREEMLENLRKIPAGFASYIEQSIPRLRETHDAWFPAFELLCVAKGPLTSAELSNMTELRNFDFAGGIAWPVRRWLRGYNNGFAFSHDSIRRGFENVLLPNNDDRGKVIERLLAYCRTWEANLAGHNSTYALRHYPEHLLDQIVDGNAAYAEELYALCQSDAFLTQQRETFPYDAGIHLRTIQTGIRAAALMDDPLPLARSMLLHARAVTILRNESPLDALEKGSLDRALSLALGQEPHRRVFDLALVAWACLSGNDLDGAKRTLAHLEQIPAVRIGAPFDKLLPVVLNVLAAAGLHETYAAIVRHMNDESLVAWAGMLSQQGSILYAKRTAEAIDHSWSKVKALAAIAQWQVSAGQIEDGRQTLVEARETAEAIDDPWFKARALAAIAQGQVSAGQIEEARHTFDAILASTQTTANVVEVVKRIAMALPIAETGLRPWGDQLIAVAQSEGASISILPSLAKWRPDLAGELRDLLLDFVR